MSFPTKSEREKCWASRDDLWKCLDEKGDGSELCAQFRKVYESSCPSQWVKHFDRKREYLKFKDRIQNDGHTSGLQPQKVSSALLTPSSSASATTECSSPTPTTPRVFRKFPQSPTLM